MQFHMREVLKGRVVPLQQTLDVSQLLGGRRDVLSAGPLDCRLKASPEEGTVRVTGELDIRLELACSRCLEPVKEHLRVPFDESFAPADHVKSEEEDEDAPYVHPVDGDLVELEPYVYETLLLSIPFVPLCREDCEGLCPECGTNRNESPCGCSREKVDPRLEALKGWFDSK